MFCEKCGKEIPDSTKFCPYCGAPVSKAQDFGHKAGEAFNAAEQELGSAFDEVKQSFTGNSANQQNAGGQYNGSYQNTEPDSTTQATRITEPDSTTQATRITEPDSTIQATRTMVVRLLRHTGERS